MGIKSIFACAFLFALSLTPLTLSATPSSHTWTPSIDVQPHGSFHLTADFFIPSENDATGSKPNTVTNVGLEAGLWPIKDKLGFEFGFDHISGFGPLDDYPLYFNAKVGVPEGVLFEDAPGLAFGGYLFGTEHDETNQNIFYIKTAKTILLKDFSPGRFSVGWFRGNRELLVDENQDSDSDGPLLTWDRTMSEISEQLSLSVDYQGTDSSVGALVPGFAWSFADNVSVTFGYVIPNNDDLAETYAVEVDIDFGG